MSLAEIAARAGVAKGTASKVLNHYSGISSQTRQRVMAAARALGVRPRRYRSAAPDANRTVVVLPMAESLFRELQKSPSRLTAHMFHAFQQDLAARDYGLLLGPAGLSDEQAIQYVHEHLNESFAAVALLPPVGEALARFLHQRRIPSLCLSGSEDLADLAVVTADHSQGTRLLVRHLVELGHRRIGYVGSGLLSRSHLERLQGFLVELQIAGLPCRQKWILQPPLAKNILIRDRLVERWHGSIVKFLDRFVSERDVPTALVCVNDDFARKVVELLSVRGLSVPEDVSVTGWGNEIDQSLTTIDARPAELGHVAARLITAQMQERDCFGGRLLVPVSLVARGSTAPPPIPATRK